MIFNLIDRYVLRFLGHYTLIDTHILFSFWDAIRVNLGCLYMQVVINASCSSRFNSQVKSTGKLIWSLLQLYGEIKRMESCVGVFFNQIRLLVVHNESTDRVRIKLLRPLYVELERL
ncbi:hypothetical protein C469_00861 [Halorubrum lipolyticum DSM 21995]|uniref:Uncharacterized protein n=1 Tax=Halorubrum lipolyticum DSM 21995 TaxID=1227482 RepID=M0P3P9_9EURY|nr:hypothetical protein C469_00861 [Halorubrum lipolyticum DSM 21995]